MAAEGRFFKSMAINTRLQICKGHPSMVVYHNGYVLEKHINL